MVYLSMESLGLYFILVGVFHNSAYVDFVLDTRSKALRWIIMGLAMATVLQLTSSWTEHVVVETTGVAKINSSAVDPSSDLLYRTL